jgi:hypothetical protein
MTKAQQLGITKFPYEEKDEKGRVIYREYGDGRWSKTQFDAADNIIEYENSELNEFCCSRRFDDKRNKIWEIKGEEWKIWHNRKVIINKLLND